MESLVDRQRPYPGRQTHARGSADTRLHRRRAAAIAPVPAPQTPGRLHEYFERTCDRTPDAMALECGAARMSYRELDERANRLANHLLGHGARAGGRIGILVPRSVDMYVALLGVLKTGATFVPIDPAAPADRIAFVAADAALDLVVTTPELRASVEGIRCDVVVPGEIADQLESAASCRPALGRVGDDTCYVLYTSGSTGRPKGVEVAQTSICNFIGVVGDVYGVRPSDRVYQGMTIAFDFSIEEIWPTWAAGAALIAGPAGADRIGSGLADFLEQQRITVLYCVPTVLATIDRDLPAIRSLLVGGEACPAELVQRWSVPGRRMLNTYGPTEATVTATWCELHPGRPVTIGRPLPTYRIAILDDRMRAVRDGSVGEICIGGPGVARGYLNRADLTADRFVDNVAAAGGSRLYRTGDLGRVLPDGEIEYLGRADSEVKVRGHRIDLQEIESILLQDPAVTGAAVTPHPDSPTEDLVAYLAVAAGDDPEAVLARLHESLRLTLTAYMVPRFAELLDELPLMTSGKVDRGALPHPTGRPLRANAGQTVTATTATERALAGIWSGLIGIPPTELSVESDFFIDLGGHSLLAARAVSELRESGVAPAVSVADIYAYPTITGLAARLDGRGPSAVEPRPAATAAHAPGVRPLRVYVCGAAQLTVIAAVLLILMAPPIAVLATAGGTVAATTVWQELAVVPLTYLLGRFVLPIIGVRLLSRRVRAGEYPLWGRDYLRFWTIRFLMSLAPLGSMSGSPLLPWYLRLLGARIGRDCRLVTRNVGLPSLLRLGDDVSVGYEAHLQTFRVERGRVVLDTAVLGDRTFVGANAVVEPGAEIGDDAGLAEMSVATRGLRIAAGEHWSGSPPERVTADPLVEQMRATARQRSSRGIRTAYASAWVLVELLPLVLIAPVVGLCGWAYLSGGAVGGWLAVLVSGPLFVLTTCFGVALVKRVVLPVSQPGVYSVDSGFGVRKWLVDKLLQLSLASTNSLYATLYTPGWLRLLGARIGVRSEISTTANLDPDLLTIGEESFVADMAAVGAATYCNGLVAVGPTVIGRRSFVGNAAFLRSGTTVGDECLIGVHTSAPGEHVATGTEWLGSPAIRLPQRQDSGQFADQLTFHPTRARVLERFVIEYFRIVIPATVLFAVGYAMVLAELWVTRGAGVIASLLVALPLAATGAAAVVAVVAMAKWLVVGRYRPRVEPLWSRFVRRTEFVTALYETAAVPALLGMLTGTPLLGPALRVFGARIGKRCWIDTTFITEFDLVDLADDCCVGGATSLQTHLFEDRVMKMSYVHVGARATVGARSVVLYDSIVGDDTVVDAMSLVMKGEHLPAGTAWQGIPARAAVVAASET